MHTILDITIQLIIFLNKNRLIVVEIFLCSNHKCHACADVHESNAYKTLGVGTNSQGNENENSYSFVSHDHSINQEVNPFNWLLMLLTIRI